MRQNRKVDCGVFLYGTMVELTSLAQSELAPSDECLACPFSTARCLLGKLTRRKPHRSEEIGGGLVRKSMGCTVNVRSYCVLTCVYQSRFDSVYFFSILFSLFNAHSVHDPS